MSHWTGILKRSFCMAWLLPFRLAFCPLPANWNGMQVCHQLRRGLVLFIGSDRGPQSYVLDVPVLGFSAVLSRDVTLSMLAVPDASSPFSRCAGGSVGKVEESSLVLFANQDQMFVYMYIVNHRRSCHQSLNIELILLQSSSLTSGFQQPTHSSSPTWSLTPAPAPSPHPHGKNSTSPHSSTRS